MEGIKLKEDFFEIKKRIDNIEVELNNQLLLLTEKEIKWKQMDATAEEIKSQIGNKRVTFNICGKRFQTTVNTLLNTKDTFFYKLFINKEIDINSEIFFDCDPKLFSLILDFLRTKSFDKSRINSSKLRASVRQIAEKFEINDILNEFGVGAKDIEFVDFKFSGAYITSGITVGTNKLEDLSDRSLMKGICTASPGWITIELNDEWDIKGLEIGGYAGNTNYWSPDNGNSAQIKVSVDNIKFDYIATIPSGYGTNIAKVVFSTIRCRWIKFDYTSHLGIGFLSLEKA